MTKPILDIRPYAEGDAAEISALHSRAFGPGRFTRTAYRVREGASVGMPQGEVCCRVGSIGSKIAAAVTMTAVTIGGRPGAMLLGPLVVAPEYAGNGFGDPVVRAALKAAQDEGCELVVLVGDLAYYSRFGFQMVRIGSITLPGPVDPKRLLAVELTTASLARFSGPVGYLAPPSTR